MDMRKILVAFDESDQAQMVFAAGLDLAQSHQAELVLLHCIPDDLAEHSIGLSEQFGMSPYLFDQAYRTRTHQLEQRIEQATVLLQQYQERAIAAGVPASFEYKVGNPEAWICPLATALKVDLIVIGRRGRRGLTEIMLGSVSNYVLHHAPCSVFVVQPMRSPAAAPAPAAPEVAQATVATPRG